MYSIIQCTADPISIFSARVLDQLRACSQSSPVLLTCTLRKIQFSVRDAGLLVGKIKNARIICKLFISEMSLVCNALPIEGLMRVSPGPTPTPATSLIQKVQRTPCQRPQGENQKYENKCVLFIPLVLVVCSALYSRGSCESAWQTLATPGPLRITTTSRDCDSHHIRRFKRIHPSAVHP